MSTSTAGRRTPSRRDLRAANPRPRAPFLHCLESVMGDPRLTPARGDLAAKHLEGKVKAARFVEGVESEISDPIVPVRERPAADAAFFTQALKAERVTIYERGSEGFAWGQ